MILFGATAGVAIYNWYKQRNKVDELTQALDKAKQTNPELKAALDKINQSSAQGASNTSNVVTGDSSAVIASYQKENAQLREQVSQLTASYQAVTAARDKAQANVASLLQIITAWNQSHPDTPIVVDVNSDGIYVMNMHYTETTTVVTEG